MWLSLRYGEGGADVPAEGHAGMHPTFVESVLNARTAGFLKERELAEIIAAGQLPEDWRVQICDFFTETPVRRVLRFAREHGISEDRLRTYYETHIRELCRNPELEEALS